MHDGSLPTLDAVVDFYSQGGRANPHLDARVSRKDFSPQEKLALVVFLKTLTGQLHEGTR